MSYPTAIVLAAALIAGAVVASSRSNAESSAGSVALTSSDGQTVWVAREGGEVRVCRLDSRGTAQLGILCSEWN
jgi:photosystem II stability/assembly factor-like uncharacterized protein